ncbi:SpoIIE family protein phosphatase [Clostridium sp. JS66]|uniref:SpoIIE family protein phosphatase n=1 Tax=Clostridium sp. JS66 TaxID=3064705 RepID=UPI00298E4028|nr:SpoIIE family protein phosphatase [Clostridium sp. JS66]WPC44326.1 SpoIIE family protein phosphatase [Clostridium sp. JS66]
MSNVDLGMCFKALLGPEWECGDISVIKEYDNQCFIALIDVLGHGSEAREIALSAKKYLESNYKNELIDLMKGLHKHLEGTRGAAAAMYCLDIFTGELTYVGVGNITFRIFGAKPIRLVPRDGVVGYIMTNPEKRIVKLYPNDIVLMYSDGIKEHFDEFECAGLLKEDAENIAAGILEKFGKKDDDASCVVLKYLM